jgi:hypothetical protein
MIDLLLGLKTGFPTVTPKFLVKSMCFSAVSANVKVPEDTH